MFRTISIAALAIAAAGVVGPAMAAGPYGQIDNQNYKVEVNVEVAPEVTMWAGSGAHAGIPPIQLLMNGAPGGTNAAAAQSSITHMNNVLADIDVAVSGNIPEPIVPGGGVLFYIFKNGFTQPQAISAINSTPYSPAGALIWTSSNEGASQSFATSLPVATSAATKVVTYGASSPGELPLPTTFSLDVVWTISAS